MTKIILLILSPLLILIYSARAGLNDFTKLDKIEDWIIERKFDASSDEILCRASKIGYGTWFGARIRLDKNGNLVVPRDLSKEPKPSLLLLGRVKEALRRCRSGFVYMSMD